MTFPGEGAISLARELALLGARCTAEARGADGGPPAWPRSPFRALGGSVRAQLASDDPALARLRVRLGLPAAAAWMVLSCAAAECHRDAAEAFSFLLGDAQTLLPTPYAVALLLHLAWEEPFEPLLCAVGAGGAAERLGLVERVEAGPFRPLSLQPYRLSALEAGHLLGGLVPPVEPSLLTVLREPPAQSTALPEALVRNALALLVERGVLCVRCPSARVGRQLAIDLATLEGREAWVVLAGDEPPAAVDVARLRGGLVAVDLFGPCLTRSFPDAWLRAVASQQAPLVALVPLNAHTGSWPAVELDDFDRATRRRVWRLVVGDGAADALALRFKASLDEVRSAAATAGARARLRGVEVDEAALTAEVLAQGARRMGRNVTLLRGGARFDDLVVPAGLRDTLAELIDCYRASATVFDRWGLGARTPLGRGLACLFSGPPGTGKTFAAQCVAAELGLNLYRVDLSQVVSKYIGETEKSLARVFEEAEAGHGVLLFDEADALFGKRSEVKDAHDRYANVEVAYLLQRMESFEGLSILTTNLRNNLDAAFLRRLRFVVEFPMPDAGMRATLWERALPPREHWHPEVDLAPLIERFPLAGGHIHTVGLAASHLAAASPEGRLRVEHMVRATWRELEKLGLSRSREDFGALARFLPGASP